MSEVAEDDYLWTNAGPVDPQLARLERELGQLRWTPRELVLEGEGESVDERAQALAKVVELRERSSEGSRWRPALIAGVLAAAAVLVLLLRPPVEPAPRPDAPVVAPPRVSPDLKDPFAPREQGFTSPIHEREQDTGAASPRLRDPFAPDEDEQRSPKPNHGRSPDLKDPFARGDTSGAKQTKRRGSGSKPRDDEDTKVSPFLKDPFSSGAQEDPQQAPSSVPSDPDPDPSGASPDLKDPFASRGQD